MELEEIVRIRSNELESVADYDNIERRLKRYKPKRYLNRSLNVKYVPDSDKVAQDDVMERSGVLTVEFNRNYLDNSINGIDYFCIYNDGRSEPNDNPDKTKKNVIASFKHSADRYVHQLAFNLTNKKGVKKTVGIAILVDCNGMKISGDKLKEYIVLEGFTAPRWFSDLKIGDGDDKDIYDFVIDEINNYIKKRSKFSSNKKLFVNCSHSKNNRQKANRKLIKRIADRYHIRYDRKYDLVEVDEVKFDGFSFTHFMKKRQDIGFRDVLSNIHFMHTWNRFQSVSEDDALYEKLTSEIKRRRFSHKELVINRSEEKYPTGWAGCSGLVYGFEIDTKEHRELLSPELKYRLSFLNVALSIDRDRLKKNLFRDDVVLLSLCGLAVLVSRLGLYEAATHYEIERYVGGSVTKLNDGNLSMMRNIKDDCDSIKRALRATFVEYKFRIAFDDDSIHLSKEVSTFKNCENPPELYGDETKSSSGTICNYIGIESRKYVIKDLSDAALSIKLFGDACLVKTKDNICFANIEEGKKIVDMMASYLRLRKTINNLGDVPGINNIY